MSSRGRLMVEASLRQQKQEKHQTKPIPPVNVSKKVPTKESVKKNVSNFSSFDQYPFEFGSEKHVIPKGFFLFH